MTLFNGNRFAEEREHQLKLELEQLNAEAQPSVAAILFQEDQGSQLYTRLKKEAAERVGIKYEVYTFSMRDDVTEVLGKIDELNRLTEVTGIIIQKPWRKSWHSITGLPESSFAAWWQTLTEAIDLQKDIDGLHPQTLADIKAGTWEQHGRVLPATCQAVWEILQAHQLLLPERKIIILGKSDILGQPLYYLLQNAHFEVEMIGSQELQTRKNQGINLYDADIIVSATGRHHLITGALIKEGANLIDVGEPKPDVEFATVQDKASFITPVPGGVGPVTVICLLENSLQLFKRHL